jgi:GTPase SAR1 family protein
LERCCCNSKSYDWLQDERDVLLGVWDTAGSERYESMSRIYYRGAKAAIICYDVTNESSWDKVSILRVSNSAIYFLENFFIQEFNLNSIY